MDAETFANNVLVSAICVFYLFFSVIFVFADVDLMLRTSLV